MMRIGEGSVTSNAQNVESNQQIRFNSTPNNTKTRNDQTDGNAISHLIDTVVKAVQTAVQVAKVAPTKTPPISYERSDKTIDYMFNEMKTNINSPAVKNIKSQLEYADFLMHPKGWKERISAAFAQSGGDNAGNHINAALIQWGLKVRPNGDWDHKPKLDKMLGLGAEKDYYFPIRGDDKHEVFYDIWSNIHYGYVGSAAGFDGKTLQDGAQAADGIAGRNDKVDEVTVQIGIDLWSKYGANMTKEQFHQEVVNRLPQIIAAQQSQDSHQVIPIKNGH